jgi:hypothetical protein
MMTDMRGASNAKANRELAWNPAHPSWREGFRGIDEHVAAVVFATLAVSKWKGETLAGHLAKAIHVLQIHEANAG